MLLANLPCNVDDVRKANPDLAAARVTVCHLAPPPPVPSELPAYRGYALAVGRMAAEERYKGHEALIAAWPAVRTRVPHAELVIVGDGNDRPRLEAFARSHALGDGVRFTGRVGEAALSGYYDHAAFFVLPSAAEGFGLVYLEAMRAGLACIAAPGAACEVIADGATGVIVDPQRDDDLTRAVTALFLDPERSAAMGRAGAARVRDRFTPERFAAAVRASLGLAGVPA
jgi:phosphatidylinositol alpha-1,6-mannosyltransferase